MDIKQFLSSIGFGKNEVEVYVALIEFGSSSVLGLAKRTKIHRSNIYDALRNLLQQGLVYEINQSPKLFSARHPKSLLNYLQYREAELTELIKNYDSRVGSFKSAESKVKISKGLFAVRQSIYSLLETNDTIQVYGIPLASVELIGPILKDFHKERIKRKILMRHIYNSEGKDRARYLNKLKYTEAKTLPQKYDSTATTNIAGNKIVIFLWDKEVTVIEIEDDSMAQPYKNYFNILWEKAIKAT